MKHVGGYTGHAWEGDKYESRDVKEIAALVRKDIKDAIAKNELPKGKYSVTIDRFSGGRSCDISVKELEFPVLNKEEVIYRRTNPNWYSEGRAGKLYTEVATLALEKLTSILNQYRRDDSDGMIDYFNTNFYGHAKIDYDLERKEESEIA